MEKYISQKLMCPSCGNEEFDLEKQCVCGFSADESFITNSSIKKARRADRNSLKKPKCHDSLKHEGISGEHVLKEIDSWMFTYSGQENCISIGTPALQSFSLQLTVDDLEELLESVYRKTGREKTTRKLQLPYEEITDVIEMINRMIEEKRSKVMLDFSDEELEEVKRVINDKLKQ